MPNVTPTATAISTEAAPTAIGPYSQAVRVGDTVYLSGQIALEPASMRMIDGGFEQQAEQVFKNLSAVTKAAGGSLDNAVKLTVYLTDLDNFSCVNEVMSRFFSQPYPARAAVEVAALPKNAMVEVDAVLHIVSE